MITEYLIFFFEIKSELSVNLVKVNSMGPKKYLLFALSVICMSICIQSCGAGQAQRVVFSI